MFRGLRLRLTLTYLVGALALIILLGAGTYALLVQYFQSGTDLALQHEMANQFRQMGKPVPQELAAADRSWNAHRSTLPPVPVVGEGDEDDHSGSTGQATLHPHSEFDETYNAELAAIFALPVSSDGTLLTTANTVAPPMSPDTGAVTAALLSGSDWRTIQLTNGERVRLFTYRVPGSGQVAAIQLGRSLGDQEQTLTRLMLVLLLLGGASAVLLGGVSWWVAGRSLRPAQQAWERQQAFVANASHELRTPLAIMRASTEVALRGLPSRDADRRELLGDVLQECDHMSSLVDDLLLLSRLDAGRLQLEQSNIEANDLLADVQRQASALAGRRGVNISVSRAEGTALGDPTRLRQVLLILIDNALRHTPQGGSITLSAYQDGHDERLEVADTGTGISPQDLPHIFERFYRGADSTAQSEAGKGGGSGLGLSIARSLMSAQGGKIAISSEPGRGTTVTLTLPRQGAAGHKVRRESPVHSSTHN